MAEPIVRNVQQVMEQLAEQIREEYAKPIKGVIAAPSLGVGYWTMGLLVAVVGVALLVGLPLGRQLVLAPPQVAEHVTGASSSPAQSCGPLLHRRADSRRLVSNESTCR